MQGGFTAAENLELCFDAAAAVSVGLRARERTKLPWLAHCRTRNGEVASNFCGGSSESGVGGSGGDYSSSSTDSVCAPETHGS